VNNTMSSDSALARWGMKGDEDAQHLIIIGMVSCGRSEEQQELRAKAIANYFNTDSENLLCPRSYMDITGVGVLDIWTELGFKTRQGKHDDPEAERIINGWTLGLNTTNSLESWKFVDGALKREEDAIKRHFLQEEPQKEDGERRKADRKRASAKLKKGRKKSNLGVSKRGSNLPGINEVDEEKV